MTDPTDSPRLDPHVTDPRLDPSCVLDASPTQEDKT